jgi:hypothetical protein
MDYTGRTPHPNPLPFGRGEGERRQFACVFQAAAPE